MWPVVVWVSGGGGCWRRKIVLFCPRNQKSTCGFCRRGRRGGEKIDLEGWALAGIEWALEKGCQVIPMSLGASADEGKRVEEHLHFGSHN